MKKPLTIVMLLSLAQIPFTTFAFDANGGNGGTIIAGDNNVQPGAGAGYGAGKGAGSPPPSINGAADLPGNMTQFPSDSTSSTTDHSDVF